MKHFLAPFAGLGLLLGGLLAGCSVAGPQSAASTPAAHPAPAAGAVPIIFDSDMGPDYDDVGAIAVLHALADSGRATILATVASSKYPKVGPVLSVFNTYFSRPNLPLGVPKGAAVSEGDKQHWSDTITARYPHAVRTSAELPDPVQVYRQVLAAQPDTSVTVVTVGFLTNLVSLLASPPDQYSPLAGPALIKQKVKRLVCMAGQFPQGREFNVYKDVAAARTVFSTWPTSVLFSGWEIGDRVRTGLPLVRNPARRNPVQDVFRISIPLDPNDRAGRMSWDQTAVLVAVLGPAPYYTLQAGRITLQPDGANGWDPTGKGHQYLVEARPITEVQTLLDRLMQHQPGPATR